MACSVPSILATSLLVATLLGTASAHADEQTQLAAEAAFTEGVRLMKDHRCADAVVKFRESQALDLASGTALNIAYCEMELGHTASAWLAYRQAISLAQQQGKPVHERLAREQADQLERRVPHLLLVVNSRPGTALDVQLDGRPVTSDMWSVPLPVDPGVHRVVASVNGTPVWIRDVKVSAGERVTLAIAPAGSVGAPTATTDVRAVPAPAGPAGESPAKPGSASTALESRVGLVLGGAAVLSLGFGAYFGGRAIAYGSSVERACTGDACSSRVKADYDAGRADAWRANVLIGTGLVAAAVSVYFLVRSNARTDHRAALRPLELRF